jgi:hypothetical protein
MCRARNRQLGQHHGRAFFPELTPPPLNYAVVTGELLSDPRAGKGPSGDPVALLEIEFPVAHPEHPRFLWAYTTYDVEVAGDIGGSDLEELHKGASVLVWGQLSERVAIEDGRMSRHPVIVAASIHSGPLPDTRKPTAPAGPPSTSREPD